MLEDQTITHTYKAYLTINPESQEKFLNYVRQIEEDPELISLNHPSNILQTASLSLLNPSNILKEEVVAIVDLSIRAHPKNRKDNRAILLDWYDGILEVFKKLEITIDAVKIEEPLEQSKQNKNDTLFQEFKFKFAAKNLSTSMVNKLLKGLVHDNVHCSLVINKIKEHEYTFIIKAFDLGTQLVGVSRISQVLGYIIKTFVVEKSAIIFQSYDKLETLVFSELIDNRILLMKIQDHFIDNRALIKTIGEADVYIETSDKREFNIEFRTLHFDADFLFLFSTTSSSFCNLLYCISYLLYYNYIFYIINDNLLHNIY